MLSICTHWNNSSICQDNVYKVKEVLVIYDRLTSASTFLMFGAKRKETSVAFCRLRKKGKGCQVIMKFNRYLISPQLQKFFTRMPLTLMGGGEEPFWCFCYHRCISKTIEREYSNREYNLLNKLFNQLVCIQTKKFESKFAAKFFKN